MLQKALMLSTVQPRDSVNQGKLYRHNPYVGLLRSLGNRTGGDCCSCGFDGVVARYRLSADGNEVYPIPDDDE